MTATEFYSHTGHSQQHINKLILAASRRGESFISLRGERYGFTRVSGRGRGGKTYLFTPLDTPAPKTRRRGERRVDMAALEALGVDLEHPSREDRVVVVQYIIAHPEYSVSAIAWGFNTLFGDKWSVKSLEKRLRRWVRDYQTHGKSALDDRRGGRESQVDRELFLMSIVKNGTLKSYYLRYAAMWCRREGVELDLWNPRANVTYAAYTRYFHAHRNDTEVRMLLRGMDAIDETLPVYASRAQLEYPNQLWQIDATKIDLMVKVPVIDGEEQFFQPQESDEYVLVRYTLNGIVDAMTGARVYKLMKSGTSYGNARLLEKAIGILGVPEIIKGDNGKDYTSKHFQSVLEDLGIVYQAATPYKGSEKGTIERGFRTLQHDARFEVLPGFITHSVDQRQIAEAQAAPKSRRGGAGRQTALEEDFMWWWEAERVIDGLIQTMFADALALHARLVRHTRTIAHLHQRLGRSGTRRLSRGGVQWQGALYTSPELWHHYDIGDPVVVREEIDDGSIVYVEDTRGGFIACTSDRASISLEEAQASKRAYKKAKTAKIKQIVTSAKSEAAKLGELTRLELEALSTLPAPDVRPAIPAAAPVIPSVDQSAKMAELIKAAGY